MSDELDLESKYRALEAFVMRHIGELRAEVFKGRAAEPVTDGLAAFRQIYRQGPQPIVGTPSPTADPPAMTRDAIDDVLAELGRGKPATGQPPLGPAITSMRDVYRKGKP